MSLFTIKTAKDVIDLAQQYYDDNLATFYTKDYLHLLTNMLMGALGVEEINVVHTQIPMREILMCVLQPTSSASSLQINDVFLCEPALMKYINMPIALELNYMKRVKCFDPSEIFLSETDNNNDDNNDLFSKLCEQSFDGYDYQNQPKLLSEKYQIQIILIIRIILVVHHFVKHIKNGTLKTLEHKDNIDDYNLLTGRENKHESKRQRTYRY